MYLHNVALCASFNTRKECLLTIFNLNLITNMSIDSRRALSLVCTWSHKLGFEVALWHQHSSIIKACTICKEGLIKDEHHQCFTCSTCSAICDRYDDILKGSDDLSVTLKKEHGEGWPHICMPYSHVMCFKVWIPLLKKETHNMKTCALRLMGQY